MKSPTPTPRPLAKREAAAVKQSPSRTIAKGVLGFILAVVTLGFIADNVSNAPVRYNPIFGWERIPGEQHWQMEGNGVSLWSSNCIRRASMPAVGSPAPFLIVGDSFTEALHVSDKDHFAHLLEEGLPPQTKRPVLAFGHSAYSVADYIARAPDFIKLYSPHWVTVQINDLDFGADAWNRGKKNTAYFVSDTNVPSMIAIHDCIPGPPPAKRSPIMQKYASILRPLSMLWSERLPQIEAWISHEKPWFGLHVEPVRRASVSQKPGYPIDAEMELLANAYNHRLTILYLPAFDPRNPAREEAMEQQVSEAANRHHVEFISLRQRFPELAIQGLAPYGFNNTTFNAGHWNRYGHQAAAQLLLGECERVERGTVR